MPFTFVAVDTETTGLDPEHDRLIELAAVRFTDGAPVAVFEALLSPGDRALSPVSRLITGLRDEELAAAPPAADSLRAFLEFAGDAPLVAHNAEFDARVVRTALDAAGLAAPPGPWLDTLLLSRIAWPAWDNHRLDSLADRLRIPRDGEHRALPDARRAGFVFLAAEAALRAELPASARAELSRLAADLPDWSLVFKDPETNGNVGESSAAVPSSGASADPPEGPVASVADASGKPEDSGVASVAEALSGVLVPESDGWLVLETPPGCDEAAGALRAAIAAAADGARILLAVPDVFAWNLLRKSATAAAAPGRIAALAEPSGYLCRARLAALVANPARVPVEERAALLPLVVHAHRAPGDPVAASRGFSPERARLSWLRVCCDAWSDDPAAAAARADAATAGVILVTHATLCAHVAAEGALLPPCDAVIVTGAHRFPDAAHSPAGAGRAVSLFRLRDTLQLLRAAPDRDDGVWGDLAPLLDEEARASFSASAAAWFEPDALFQKFLQKAGRQAARARPQGDFRVSYAEPLALAFGVDPEPVLSALRANEGFLDRCGGLVETAAENDDRGSLAAVLARARSRLRAFRADFEELCEARDGAAAYWFEDVSNPHRATLRAVPRDPAVFGEALRALFGAGAFVSPALIAGDRPARDARWFLGAAGLDDPEAEVTVRRVSLPSAAAPPAPRFLMAPFAPPSGGGEHAEAFARFVAGAVGGRARRGVLVFCPSHTAVRALHGALRRALAESGDGAAPGEAIPVWAQHADGNRDALARLYASGRGGYVIATEGLGALRDADGKAPALWLIVRMPLPPPHDPLLAARGEALRAEGRNARQELWHPAAILRLKREWAAVKKGGAPGPEAIWLLDARASAEGLGARLAGALGCAAVAAKDAAELGASAPADGAPGP